MDAKVQDALDDNLAALPGIRPVSDAQLPLLAELLRHYDWTDPYCGSAAYYGLTGRHGLWLAMKDDAFMPICRHPNQPEKLLLFPPTGEAWRSLMHHVLRHLPPMPEGIQFARFPPELIRPAESLGGVSGPGWQPQSALEDALDWRFPVHVLDTVAVAAHEGQRFRDFRHNLHRARTHTITSEPLIPAHHRKDVASIAAAWAKNKGDCPQTDTAESYRRMLDLFVHLPMRGRLYRVDGAPAAFSIWEETDKARGIANTFADLTTGNIRGLSEFVMHDMARRLADRGFSRVCIGGSETPGLDAYKRKLNPVESVAVRSLHLRPTFDRRRHPALHITQ